MKWALSFTMAVSLACGLASPVEQGPVVLVMTPLPGISPEDVDNTIAIPMHAALASVADVVRVDSVSTDGQAEVSVSFAPGSHMYAVRADVAEALTHVQLPDSAEIPMLMPWWDERIEVTLETARAVDFRQALMELPGVNDVRLRGIPQRRVLAEVNPARMAALGLGASDLLEGRHLEDVSVVTVSEHAEVDVQRQGRTVAVAEILVTDLVFRPTLEEELARFEATRMDASIRLDMDCPDRQTCSTLATDLATELGAPMTEVTDRRARVWTEDLAAAQVALGSRPAAQSTLRTAHNTRLMLSSSSDTPLTEPEITQLRESIGALSGVVSLSPRHVGEPDLNLEVDRERVAMLGISMRSVTQTIQLQTGISIYLNGDTLLLRWAETPLEALPIVLPTGGTVSLGDVSTITLTPRSAPIYRRDGLRAHAVDVYLQDEDVRLDPSSLVLPQGWTADIIKDESAPE